MRPLSKLLIVSNLVISFNTFSQSNIRCDNVSVNCMCPCPDDAFYDDRKINLQSIKSVNTLRDLLIKKIWGQKEIPITHDNLEVNLPSSSKYLDEVQALGMSKNPSLKNVEVLNIKFRTKLNTTNCQTLDADGVTHLLPDSDHLKFTIAYHFVPVKPIYEVVILHQGHTNSIEADTVILGVKKKVPSYGFKETVESLLARGFDVVVVFMPQHSPVDKELYNLGNCHTCIVKASLLNNELGMALKIFFEPTVTVLAFFQEVKKYKKFHMIGLSGGGWATTFYSALDSRITTSFSIAPGLMPFYLFNKKPGDAELCDSSIYNYVKVQQLYVLAAQGKGRKHFEIFIKKDIGGSNGELFYKPGWYTISYPIPDRNPSIRPETYDQAIEEVRKTVNNTMNMLDGHFDIVIDTSTSQHRISHKTISDLILHEIASQ